MTKGMGVIFLALLLASRSLAAISYEELDKSQNSLLRQRIYRGLNGEFSGPKKQLVFNAFHRAKSLLMLASRDIRWNILMHDNSDLVAKFGKIDKEKLKYYL